MYEVIDGIKIYDRSSALQNDDFESRCFPIFEKYASNNFWYKYRNILINYFIEKKIKQRIRTSTFLEIGCGNGIVSAYIKNNQNFSNQSACDIYLESIKYSSKRLKNIEIFQYNLFNKNLCKKFDVVGCFDVLEHIEDDVTALENILSLLTEKGVAIITVPSDLRLWSGNDVVNKHKRRYSRNELRNKVKSVGFSVDYINHFNFLLYPIMYLSRFMKKDEPEDFKEINLDGLSDVDLARMLNLKIPRFLNYVFGLITNIEFVLIKMGLKPSFGSSLIAVIKK